MGYEASTVSQLNGLTLSLLGIFLFLQVDCLMLLGKYLSYTTSILPWNVSGPMILVTRCKSYMPTWRKTGRVKNGRHSSFNHHSID